MADIDWRGYRLAAWVGLAVLVVTIGLALAQGRRGEAFLLVACLALLAVGFVLHNRLPSFFALLVVIAALLSAGGWAWNLYRGLLPYDEIAHGVTVLAVTLAGGFYVYRVLLEVCRSRRWLLGIMLVTLGLALGATWEVVEIFFLVPQERMTLHDTITDLVVDGTGAVLAVPFGFWALKQRPPRSKSDQV